MELIEVGESDRDRWNDFVTTSPSFGLLQSYEWGEFKEGLGWKAIRLAAQQQGQITAGAQLLIRTVLAGLFSLAYVPRGPLAHWEDRTTATELLSALRMEARRHRSIFMRIEPPLLNTPEAHRRLKQLGLGASSYSNQPRTTIILDLTQGLDELLAQMHQKTRYNIRYAAKKGVTVRLGGSEDLARFYRLMQITGRRGGFTPRTLDY